MFRKILAVSVIATLAAAPAMAGNTSLKNADGTKMRIACQNSGCKVTAKKPGQKWGVVERTKGGRENFEMLVTKYNGMGYN